MLHGGPLRIWSALTDPDHRRAWSPLVFLDDPSRLGDTECTFAIQGIAGQFGRQHGLIDSINRTPSLGPAASPICSRSKSGTSWRGTMAAPG
jgi:hypothetical protein